MKEKATLTTLFGLNKRIDKQEDEKLPLVTREVQATAKMSNMEMQTDVEINPAGMDEIMQL